MLYWTNRCGDWFTKKTLCSTRFLVPNTSLLGVLWKLLFLKSVLMLSRLFYKLKRSLRSVLFGEWAGGKGLTCGRTGGSRTRPITTLCPQRASPLYLGLVNCFTRTQGHGILASLTRHSTRGKLSWWVGFRWVKVVLRTSWSGLTVDGSYSVQGAYDS